MRPGGAAVRNPFGIVPAGAELRSIAHGPGKVVVIQGDRDRRTFLRAEDPAELFDHRAAEIGFALSNRSIDADEEQAGGAAEALFLEDPAGERAADVFKR